MRKINYLKKNNKSLKLIEEINNFSKKFFEKKKFLKKNYKKNNIILVMGLPRSGTTYLSQLIFRNFQIRCIDSIAAKFWKSPLCGLLFSDLFIEQQFPVDDLKSFYGQSTNLFDPHEYSYFWNYYLKKKKIDFIKKEITQVLSYIDCPLLLRGNLLKGHISKFLEIFPNTIIIYLNRNKEDIQKSILRGRKDYFGNQKRWWSMKPSRKIKIFKLSPKKQIRYQVDYLSQEYLSELNNYPKSVMHVEYEKIVKNKHFFLRKFERAYKKKFNVLIKKKL